MLFDDESADLAGRGGADDGGVAEGGAELAGELVEIEAGGAEDSHERRMAAADLRVELPDRGGRVARVGRPATHTLFFPGHARGEATRMLARVSAREERGRRRSVNGPSPGPTDP